MWENEAKREIKKKKKKNSVITIIPFPVFKFISADMNRIKVQLNVYCALKLVHCTHTKTQFWSLWSLTTWNGCDSTIAMNWIDWYALFVRFYQMRQMFTFEACVCCWFGLSTWIGFEFTGIVQKVQKYTYITSNPIFLQLKMVFHFVTWIIFLSKVIVSVRRSTETSNI